MKFPHRLYVSTVIAVAMLVFFGVPQAAFADTLPENSYYQMDAKLESHTGEQLSFADHAGKPLIVSMFYASCPHVCPMLISTIQQVEKQLDADARENLRVLMVTVDPQHDDPAKLAEVAEERRVDGSRWRLARTVQESDTRALASVLGIKYKALPDGHFNHTSVLILLDEEGRELARSSRLGSPDAGFIEKVKQAAAAR